MTTPIGQLDPPTFAEVDTDGNHQLSAEEVQTSMHAHGLEISDDQAAFVAGLMEPAGSFLEMEHSTFSGVYAMVFQLLREAASFDNDLDQLFRGIDLNLIQVAFSKALDAADKTKQGAIANLVMTCVGAGLGLAVGAAGYKATTKIGNKPPIEPTLPSPLPPKATPAQRQVYDEQMEAYQPKLVQYTKDMDTYKVGQTKQQLYAQLWAQVGGPLAGLLAGSGQAIEQLFSAMAQILQAEADQAKSESQLAGEDSSAWSQDSSALLSNLLTLIASISDTEKSLLHV